MKPRKVYWFNELLYYFIGTANWSDRAEVCNWFKYNGRNLSPLVFGCRITDDPFVKYTNTTPAIDAFIKNCLDEFGQYDYEIDPLKPCGGWKSLDIIG